MTASAVIKEIKEQPPGEQSSALQSAADTARISQLPASEISALAQRLVEADELAEVDKLKSALAFGFYGNLSKGFCS